MGARDENKREYLMLAGDFDHEKHDPTGWLMSEKLDGMRCFWDGGISIGMSVKEIPYANFNDKDDYLVSTGLWSRGGKVVHAPEWFTKDLPRNVLLDGELWARGLPLQSIVSITRAYQKEDEWSKLSYCLFDSPCPSQFFKAGRIHAGDWEYEFEDMLPWAKAHGIVDTPEAPFKDFVRAFNNKSKGHWFSLYQTPCKNNQHLQTFLDAVVAKKGEGVMLRHPDSVWHPRRARKDLLKVKKFEDAEAIITGYRFGKITKKNSRLRGMIGSFIAKEISTDLTFEICGLNDSERVVIANDTSSEQDAKDFAYNNPDGEAPDWIEAKDFPRNKKITFKYWGRTKDGLPKFSQYWRDKIDE